MLKSPKLGRKKVTIAKILLAEPNVPHKRIKKVDVNGTKFFWIFTALRCKLEVWGTPNLQKHQQKELQITRF